MIFDIITIFPEMFSGIIATSIVKRAIEKGLVTINIIDFRDYSDDKRKKVDDTIYGGGAGMLIRVQPVVDALRSIPGYKKATKILTSPKGAPLKQKKVFALAQLEHLIIICGHYEGIDARIQSYVDEEISLGDYILTGGEIAALAIIDSVVRLLPGAIADASPWDESFTDGILEYPQYTKPASFEGKNVPEILLSGNHEEIRRFRRFLALEATFKKRPELLQDAKLTAEDLMFLERIKKGLGYQSDLK